MEKTNKPNKCIKKVVYVCLFSDINCKHFQPYKDCKSICEYRDNKGYCTNKQAQEEAKSE